MEGSLPNFSVLYVWPCWRSVSQCILSLSMPLFVFVSSNIAEKSSKTKFSWEQEPDSKSQISPFLKDPQEQQITTSLKGEQGTKFTFSLSF